jgi:hypothetical protein
MLSLWDEYAAPPKWMPVNDAGKLNNLNRGIVPKPLGHIITGFYYSCILLDLAVLIATAMYPNAVARFACEIRPMGAIAWPLFAEDLLRYSAEQCLGAMKEPSTSIILLSMKFSMGMLIFPLVCSVVAYRPQGLLTLIDACFLRVKHSEVYYGELRRWLYRLAIVVALDTAGILLSSFTKVADFNTSIVHKIALEDGFAILIPATIFYGLIFVVGVSLSWTSQGRIER